MTNNVPATAGTVRDAEGVLRDKSGRFADDRGASEAVLTPGDVYDTVTFPAPPFDTGNLHDRMRYRLRAGLDISDYGYTTTPLTEHQQTVLDRVIEAADRSGQVEFNGQGQHRERKALDGFLNRGLVDFSEDGRGFIVTTAGRKAAAGIFTDDVTGVGYGRSMATTDDAPAFDYAAAIKASEEWAAVPTDVHTPNPELTDLIADVASNQVIVSTLSANFEDQLGFDAYAATLAEDHEKTIERIAAVASWHPRFPEFADLELGEDSNDLEYVSDLSYGIVDDTIKKLSLS